MEKLRIPEKISPDILALCGIIAPFTREEISSDPRLEHIMRGHEQDKMLSAKRSADGDIKRASGKVNAYELYS